MLALRDLADALYGPSSVPPVPDIVPLSPNWARGVVGAWETGCRDATHSLETRTSLRTLVGVLSDSVV